MEHQPFENWLLDDEHLTSEQLRDLRRHTVACSSCAALVSANLALRAAPVARPANGFALRFQRRLAAERQTQRKRAVIGLVLLTLTSLGLIYWLLAPFLSYLSLSPVQLFTTWVGALVYFSIAAQALGTIGEVFLQVTFGLVPLTVWVIFLAAASGFSALWLAPLRKQNKQSKQKAYSQVRL